MEGFQAGWVQAGLAGKSGDLRLAQAVVRGRSHVCRFGGPFKDGQADAGYPGRFLQSQDGIFGFMQNMTEKDEVERKIVPGQRLRRRFPELGPFHPLPGQSQQIGAKIHPGHGLKTPGLENPGK